MIISGYNQPCHLKLLADAVEIYASSKIQPAGRSPSCSFLLLLLPVIAAFGILYRRSLSVPYQDDYDTILAFAVHYAQSPTLKAKLLDIAAEQHNEYKLGFEHSIVAAELELTHHLNFTFLTVLGDLFLLPLGYLLWRHIEQDEIGLHRRLLEFLPISLLFFSLTYWENLNWATTGLQNTPVDFLQPSCHFLIAPGKTPSTAHLLLGCLAAALAAFTSANGFLFGPVGLWILLARRAYGDLWHGAPASSCRSPPTSTTSHLRFTWCRDSSTSPGRSSF